MTDAQAREQFAKDCYLEAGRSRFKPATFWIASERSTVKLAFHDAETDILANIIAKIVARMSAYDRSACHRKSVRKSARFGRVGEDIREDVGVGVVECGLYGTQAARMEYGQTSRAYFHTII